MNPRTISARLNVFRERTVLKLNIKRNGNRSKMGFGLIQNEMYKNTLMVHLVQRKCISDENSLYYIYLFKRKEKYFEHKLCYISYSFICTSIEFDVFLFNNSNNPLSMSFKCNLNGHQSILHTLYNPKSHYLDRSTYLRQKNSDQSKLHNFI